MKRYRRVKIARVVALVTLVTLVAGMVTMVAGMITLVALINLACRDRVIVRYELPCGKDGNMLGGFQLA